MGYIRDGFNPRGAEYAATARAAEAAERTEQSMADMLTLASAPNERARILAAYDIQQRRNREASRRATGAMASLVGVAVLIAAIAGVFYLGSLSDADTPAIFKAPTSAATMDAR